MKHLDLFSGIGGFALAAQWAWGDEYETVAFCEIDKFCQKVLQKNFGDIPIYEDIKQFRVTSLSDNGRHSRTIREALPERERAAISDTEFSDRNIRRSSIYRQGETERIVDFTDIDLLTGGFPCQPFSVAGKRKGNKDDRALWPEMLRIIQETKPRWIVGENVAGFVNMALDQGITDLENEGYEVQAFIIPACAVNAPHRRDRVWIVANTESNRSVGGQGSVCGEKRGQVGGLLSEFNDTDCDASHTGREYGERQTVGCKHEKEDRQRATVESERPITCDGDRIDTNSARGFNGRLRNEVETQGAQSGDKLSGDISGLYWDNTNPISEGLQGRKSEQPNKEPDWSENWIEVATRFCRVDDGISNRVDRLKGLGNAIVPQVAYEIMKAIKRIDYSPNPPKEV